MYPECTNIVLNAMLTHNGLTSDLTRFYIDEIVYADNEKFAEIQRGDNSELLKQYNEKNYETVSDSVHAIVVIGNHGDGLLVDTQGYGYVRYLCYVPQIASYITERIEIEMEHKV